MVIEHEDRIPSDDQMFDSYEAGYANSSRTECHFQILIIPKAPGRAHPGLRQRESSVSRTYH